MRLNRSASSSISLALASRSTSLWLTSSSLSSSLLLVDPVFKGRGACAVVDLEEGGLEGKSKGLDVELELDVEVEFEVEVEGGSARNFLEGGLGFGLKRGCGGG